MTSIEKIMKKKELAERDGKVYVINNKKTQEEKHSDKR